MDGPQVVLLVAGLALLAGGTAGMMLYEGEGAQLLYSVAFAARDETLPLDDDAWSGPAASVAFVVSRLNVTEVSVSVACTDPAPLPVTTANPATVTATLAGPGGLSGEASGACGQPLVVRVPVAPLPGATTATGHSPDDALASIPPDENATGEWTLDLATSRAQSTGPVPIPNPTGTVAVTVTSWTATAVPSAVK